MKTIFKAFLNIFKYIGRFLTFLRNTFFNILFLLLFIVIVLSFLPLDTKQLPTLPTNAVLKLNISGNIVEQKKILSSFEKLFDDPIFGETQEPETAIQDILDIIEKGAEDSNIKVLLINVENMGRAGLNQLITIGEAIKAFKKTGKPVIAANDYYRQSQYFLASYADTVIINPMGGVDIHGMGVYRLYFKEAIEKLKIQYNIFKVGSYKSALEPFTRTSMSADDKQQNKVWLDALWTQFTETVEDNRKLEADKLQAYTDNLEESLSAVHGDPAKLALSFGLVDQAWTRAQITKHLLDLTNSTAKKPKVINSGKYLQQLTPSYQFADKDDIIGMIVAEGTILPGKQPTGMIGGDTLAKQIQKAKKNPRVKGLVIRVNSGGGSAFASEVIRQEILEFKKSGRPVVISMGTVAASGGYWLSANADEIWAQQSTITGSIGIFGAIPTFENSLAELGIYSDGIGTTPLAAGLNITQPLTPELKSAIQQSVEYNYDKFLKIVSDGRKIPPRKVTALAQGRVYDGRKAQELGLVDKIGNLKDAIGAAAKLANTTSYSPIFIEPQRSFKDQILKFISSNMTKLKLQRENRIFREINVAIKQFITPYLQLSDPKGIYAFTDINPKF